VKTLYLLPIFAVLAACKTSGDAHPEPIITPIEVAVAVEQACVPNTLKDKPDYVDTKEALTSAGPAGDDDAISKRLQLLYAGRAQREARLNELEPIVAACPRGKSK
jgi:hypothetical protein